MKNELRKCFKNKCKSEYSEKLAELLRQTDVYKNAKNIMLFYPLKNEVNLLSILEDETKNFYLPRINGEDLFCCPYCKGDILLISKFKTKEPTSEPVDKNLIDLIIVPALCCARNNYRLGYGAGYYDRFLVGYKGKTAVCLPKEMIVEDIHPGDYDIPVDIVITC